MVLFSAKVDRAGRSRLRAVTVTRNARRNEEPLFFKGGKIKSEAEFRKPCSAL
jgi:hypothetical protein